MIMAPGEMPIDEADFSEKELEDFWSKLEIEAKKKDQSQDEYIQYIKEQIVAMLKKHNMLVNASDEEYDLVAQYLSNYIVLEEEEKDVSPEASVAIRNIVKENVESYKTLQEVEVIIEEKYSTNLNDIDRAYIHRKYITYCLESYMQETINMLKKFIEEKNLNTIQEIIKSLNATTNISEIPEQLREKFYELIVKHKKMINNHVEIQFINQFMRVCFEQISNLSETASQEMSFVEKMLEFLNTFQHLTPVVKDLQLKEFCNDEVTFQKVLENVLNFQEQTSDLVNALKHIAEQLKDSDSLLMIDTFKQAICPYTQPIKIEENIVDDRLVIQVTGKVITMSEIMHEVEMKISNNPKIEEVHFVADVIYVDEEMKNEIWHGMNVIVYTMNLKVTKHVTWNVSGKCSNQGPLPKAANGQEGQEGKPGKDGEAGESGGNVLILADNYYQADDLFVVSEGGNGSNGQAGGNGSGGSDGKGLSLEYFNNNYPPAAKTDGGSSYVNNEKTKKTIDKNVKKYEINSRYFDSVFIVYTTEEDQYITYSFCTGAFYRGAYCLAKGSDGKPGARGGEGGLGGQGGYAGDIIFNTKEFATSKPGINGEVGKGGSYGYHGKNGWDVGYVDDMWWSKPKKYGEDGKSKLALDYSTSSSGRAWSSYMGKYAIIKSQGSVDNNIVQFKERTTKRHIASTQIQAQAARKKTLTKQSVMSTYSHRFSFILQSKTDLLKTRQIALQASLDKKYQQEKQNIEVVIKFQTNFINKSKNIRHKEITTGDIDVPKKTSQDHITELVGILKNNPSSMEKWEVFAQLELSNNDLNQLYTIYEELNNTDLKEGFIKMLLNEKKLINALKMITEKLPNYIENTEDVYFDNESRYLVEANQKFKDFSHQILGRLEQYFLENGKEERTKINELYSIAIKMHFFTDALMAAIKTFVLGVGKSERANPVIQKYYREYQLFMRKRTALLTSNFEALKKQLSLPMNSQLMDLWIKSFNDKQSAKHLRDQIEEKIGLKLAHTAFYNELSNQYNWEKCCRDEKVIKEYNEYILNKGTLSESCRELLSYIYETNIKVYTKNETDDYSLLDNHNPSKLKKIHLLLTNNKFVELTIDKGFIELEKERVKKDKLFATIFTDVESFQSKQEYDDYVNNATYMSNELNTIKYQTDLDEYRLDENEYIEKIMKFFSPKEEKQNLEDSLAKTKSQYIGQNSILHYILKRFENEGRHVSYNELYYLANSILKSFVEENNELNLYSWIIAAYPQEQWICEVILLKLEDYLRQMLPEKSKWRQNLLDIKDRNILLLLYIKFDELTISDKLSIESIDAILHLLSNIPKELYDLDKLDISEWLYALKDKYWKFQLTSLTTWSEEKLEIVSYYILALENETGNTLVEKFFAVLEKKEKLDENGYFDILLRFHNDEWNLSNETVELLEKNTVKEWINLMKSDVPSDDKDRNVTQLVKLIQGNGNTSEKVSKILPSLETAISTIKTPDYKSSTGKSIGEFTDNDIKEWTENFKKNFKENKPDNVVDLYDEMLAVINRAVQLKMGFQFRDTQHLSVLFLLKNNHNSLLQMVTGEGKTLIIVAAAIIKILCGEKVDIITSSSVLAKRDSLISKDVYSLFDVRVSHNCSEDIEERKIAYSNNDVVYGDLSSFQRDFLLDRFYKQNILNNHNFANIFIDEVDSLLLDKGNNVLYLSRDISGLDKLEAIYIFIWKWINKPASNDDDLAHTLDTNVIKEALLNDLYGTITLDDINEIDTNLSEQQVNKIWNILIDSQIIDKDSILTRDEINHNEIEELFSAEFSKYIDRIHFLIRQCIERERQVYVPNFLRPFVIEHLETWIESAKSAMFMQERNDYIIDVERSEQSADIYPKVIIIDKDTGTDQTNSQWDEALHQFLQLKHGCKISLQSLKAVFISNVTYFKLYNNMYGLTGTLGSQRERDLLKEIHDVDFINIPTTKPKKFDEKNPIFCADINEWEESIYNESLKMTNENHRSVLIICDSVSDVEKLYENFKKKNTSNIHKYTRDYEELDITKGKLDPGHIIMATNLAGRGTDIKISSELKKNGGLHVILAYLPNNVRIELQAFGRAARAGDKGSGQLIVMGPNDKGYDSSKILELKKDREVEELRRLSEIKEYYETQIKIEEHCFKEFSKEYLKWKNYLEYEEAPSDVKTIVLDSCLDRWAFWLDQNTFLIKTQKNEKIDHKIKDSLTKFIFELDIPVKENIKNWSAWVFGPYHTTRLAKHFVDAENYDKAIGLFDKAIEDEEYFSEMAHYYKAYALAKKIDFENNPDASLIKGIYRELEAAARLFDNHNSFSILAGSFIDILKQYNGGGIMQPDAYKKQKENLSNLYTIFIKSIKNILGQFVTPKSFLDVDIREEIADDLYVNLIKEGVLSNPLVNADTNEKVLRKISMEYGIPVQDLIAFLSKFKNQTISELELQDKIKDFIKLPSRLTFWELLKENNIITDEVIYLAIDEDKLKKIDPSLLNSLKEKISTNEVTAESLNQTDKTKIYLYPEQIATQNSLGIIIQKNIMDGLVSEEKYKILERRGVFSLNNKATFNNIDTDSITLPSFDFLSIEDFSRINVNKKDSEEIITNLLQQNIIKQSEGNKYKLNILYNEINDMELSEMPVYESVVKSLLHVCFSYRIALEKIKKQMKDEKPTISLNLMPDLYQKLIFDLIDENVIIPTKVQIADATDTLNKIYAKVVTSNDVLNILNDSCLFPMKLTNDFINHLIKKKWLYISQIDVDVYLNIDVEQWETLDSSYKHIEDTARLVLNNRLSLTKDDIVDKLTNKIKKLCSLLKTLETPSFVLKSMTTYFDERSFGNIEEVSLLTLNALDNVITVEEKRWTLKMILNTVAVVLIGIAEIVIGAVIEIYSVGLMTHVGGAFIGEGFSDLLYAAGAFKSGYFDWNDYGLYKAKSIAASALTAGVGSWVSKGVTVSRYGYKIAGAGLNLTEKEVAKQAGKELIKTAGLKAVGKKVARRITKKTAEGITIALSSTGADIIIENYVQSFCDNVGRQLLSVVEKTIDEHQINQALDETYQVLGEDQAQALIDEMTRKYIIDNKKMEDTGTLFFNLSSGILNGIKEAAKKIKKTGGKIKAPIETLEKVLTWAQRAEHIRKVVSFIAEFLDTLDERIMEKIKNVENKKTYEKNEENDSKKYIFKRQTMDSWKKLFSERIGQSISTEVVRPIMRECTTYLVSSVGKNIQNKYRNIKDQRHIAEFGKLKQNYHEKLQDIKKRKEEGTNVENHVRSEYQINLLKLLSKTKNPALFASIARENVPMDMACVYACAFVLRDIVNNGSKDKLEVTIVVHGDDGINKRFSTAPDATTGVVMLNIRLKNNCFTLHDVVEKNEDGKPRTNKNSSLYGALPNEIRKGMSAKEFRKKVADVIDANEQVQYIIKKGWHQLPLTASLWGGGSINNSERRRQVVPKSITEEYPLKTEIERQRKYEQPNWKFNNQTDMDLRVDRPNVDIIKQYSDGCSFAVTKINEEMSHKYPGNIVHVKEFVTTLFDSALTTTPGRERPENFPVELQRKIPVKSENKVYDYTIKLHSNNPRVQIGNSGPFGPYVGFDVQGLKNAPWKGMSGHVLLNENRKLPDHYQSKKADDYFGEIIIAPEVWIDDNHREPQDVVERFE